ncbi:hypothetical protein STEG23_001718, partial [Scotinomys teguina]
MVGNVVGPVDSTIVDPLLQLSDCEIWHSAAAVVSLDLADCKLVSFPICIYKVLRNVSDQIHLITLANNELKSLTSKFMTTFSQLR